MKNTDELYAALYVNEDKTNRTHIFWSHNKTQILKDARLRSGYSEKKNCRYAIYKWQGKKTFILSEGSCIDGKTKTKNYKDGKKITRQISLAL